MAGRPHQSKGDSTDAGQTSPVGTDAETGVEPPQPREARSHQTGKGRAGFSPGDAGGGETLPTPGFQVSGPQNVRGIFL